MERIILLLVCLYIAYKDFTNRDVGFLSTIILTYLILPYNIVFLFCTLLIIAFFVFSETIDAYYIGLFIYFTTTIQTTEARLFTLFCLILSGMLIYFYGREKEKTIPFAGVLALIMGFVGSVM